MHIFTYEGLTVEEPYLSYWSTFTKLVYQEVALDKLMGEVYVSFVGDLPGGLYGSTHNSNDCIEIEIAMFDSEGNGIPVTQIETTIAHEMIHAEQYLSGDLIQHGLVETELGLHFKYSYLGKDYINPPISDRPWESIAYELESPVAKAASYKMRFI